MNDLERRNLQIIPADLEAYYDQSRNTILGLLSINPKSPEQVKRRGELAEVNHDLLFEFYKKLPKKHYERTAGPSGGCGDVFYLNSPADLRAIQSSSVWLYESPKRQSRRIPLVRVKQPDIAEYLANADFNHFFVFGHDRLTSRLLLMTGSHGNSNSHIVKAKVNPQTVEEAVDLRAIVHAEFSDDELEELRYPYLNIHTPIDQILTGAAKRNLRIGSNDYERETWHSHWGISDDDFISFHVSDHLTHLSAAFGKTKELSGLVGVASAKRARINEKSNE